MGYTRSRRYANHASGKKYEQNPQKEKNIASEARARTKVRAQEKDWSTNEKAQSAKIFYALYTKVRDDSTYERMKAEHMARQHQAGKIT